MKIKKTDEGFHDPKPANKGHFQTDYSSD